MRHNDPPEPWELEYPYRDELWSVRRACNALTSPEPQPEVLADPNLLARAQISAAYQIECRARAFMAGRQFTGVQIHKRGVLVDDASTAYDAARAWSVGERTAEVQAWVDRAVGCLRQALDRGMDVLEWDEDGYDDVRKPFEKLLAFASAPDVTPVVLEWEEAYLGQPPLPPPRWASYKEPLHYTIGMWVLKALMVVNAVMLAVGLGHAIWTSKGCREARLPPPEVVPCPEQLQRIRARLQETPFDAQNDAPELRRSVLERIDAGDLEGAQRQLDASQASSVMLPTVQLFLYRNQCETAAENPR